MPPLNGYNASHLTAIARVDTSRPARLLVSKGLVPGGPNSSTHARSHVLDYGTGYGRDAKHYGWKGYDPNFDEWMDRPTWPEKFEYIVCTYVLCVLEWDEVEAVLADVWRWLRPGGVAYFAVRRGNRELGRKPRGKNIYSVQTDVYLNLPRVVTGREYDIYEWRKDAGAENIISEEQALASGRNVLGEAWFVERPEIGKVESEDEQRQDTHYQGGMARAPDVQSYSGGTGNMPDDL